MILREANSELVGTYFPIPEELLSVLKDAYDKYGNRTHGNKSIASEGKKRCERLLREKQLTYYQIKRMIHDMEQINPKKDPISYALNGGYEMYNWAVRVLDEARREVEARKNSQKNANDMAGLTGIRKNAYLSKHEKNHTGADTIDSILFSKTDRSQLTPMISEEINRIHQLMLKTTKQK